MSSEDVRKLPQWVQRRISKLEADVEHWRQQALAATSENAEGTDTAVRDLSIGLNGHRGLPPHSLIRFGNNEVHLQASTFKPRTGGPEVILQVGASRILEVRPNAANQVFLIARADWGAL